MTNQQHSPALAQGTNLPFPAATVLGYPRIGPNRELKRAVESFWAGRVSAAQLEQQAAELRSRTRDHLVSLGLTEPAAVPSSFSFYDQVLDVLATVGAVPPRFAHLRAADGSLDLAAYFALARGDDEVAPLEMTKWFDSNYHYLVPEIGPETTFEIASLRWVDEFIEAKDAGYLTRPDWPGADADGEVPFGTDLIFEAVDVPGLNIAVEICEDMWVPVPPSTTPSWSSTATMVPKKHFTSMPKLRCST